MIYLFTSPPIFSPFLCLRGLVSNSAKEGNLAGRQTRLRQRDDIFYFFFYFFLQPVKTQQIPAGNMLQIGQCIHCSCPAVILSPPRSSSQGAGVCCDSGL